MNGLLVIVLGVLTLYLVISGKLDCILKSMQACSGSAATPGTTAAPTTTAPVAPVVPPTATAANPDLNTVLSNSASI